ncbi:MAG: MATE family efflux transporter [Clostridiales bacterium]|nr:MATE family efflux transporter [Clostridiales bacterium]PWM40253.1 MAG: MATE family efflux transporter [Clostridiales bacterium]
MAETKNDFSKGSVARCIMNLALPMTAAQLINVLYSVVDRMYIGHLPEASTLALTGIGLTFPIISIITAFTQLFGMGGAPLCSIARGEGNHERAETVMNNSFSLLLISGAALTVFFLALKKPILYLFGASDQTFPYADAYLTIYLVGTVFVMIGLGMNSFINSQGFGRMGMMTVLLGAVVNIALDPVFIFVLNMGVQGAALATVISQFLSAAWVLRFLTGKQAIYRLKPERMRLQKRLVGQISALGLSGFIMAVTNSAVQIVCNATLQQFGGDLYVGIMTVINSIREVLTMPVNGLTNGAQPVMGYNYGAHLYSRVRSGIRFTSIVCILYTTLAWIILMMAPEFFIHIFNSDPELIADGVPALNLYFFGFFMMSLQFSGQSVFVALGKSKQAVFFSLLRKAIIVVPLTLLLPHLFGLGVNGVFLAEPISNFIGGAACFLTMLATVWPMLREDENRNLHA